MKKERLKPHIHKVKGAVNYALHDIMNGRFYQLKPEGDIQALRESLKDAGLTFETEGEVPFKIEFDIDSDTKNIRIRELQVRLNGRKEDTCWQRNTVGNGFSVMNNDVLEALGKNLVYIPVERIRIEVEEMNRAMIETIPVRYKCREIELYSKQDADKKTIDYLMGVCRENGIVFVLPGSRKKMIEKLIVEPYHFFYSRKFNPCLGEQVAVDTSGDIKSCLWSEDLLGNILKDNLKDLIISGSFNKYWETGKDKIETCRECEKRYACSDCRMSAVRKGGSFESKPAFCDYDPLK
jgi:radical SAM protein with 4Fe4S-binding SPASM domain